MKDLQQSLNAFKANTQLMHDLNITQLIQKRWKDIVGPELIKHVAFEFVRDKQCVVTVQNPCWYTEIQEYRQKILQKLNQMLSLKPRLTGLKIITSFPQNEQKQAFASKGKYDTMIGR